MLLAARSMVALKRLEKDVLVYLVHSRIRGSRQTGSCLYHALENDLTGSYRGSRADAGRVAAEQVETELTNALDS